MTSQNWTLSDGRIAAAYDAGQGVLSLQAGGTRLPWRIDLKTAHVGVKENGQVVEHPILLNTLAMHRLSQSRVQWQGQVAGAAVALDIAIDDGGVMFRASPLFHSPNALISALWPGIFRFEGRAREVFWSNFHEGALFRADGRAWNSGDQLWYHAMMRFGGFTCDGHTLLLIVDTPFDAVSRFEDDGRDAMAARTDFIPSLGELAYTRGLRLIPLAESGYVAAADHFRRYAQAKGLWKSWEQRVAERPAIDRLKGAFIASAGYLHDEDADIVGAMKKMKAMGFDRGYLFSPRLLTVDDEHWTAAVGGPLNRMSDAQMAEVQALGYLCAPFIQVEEATAAIGESLLVCDPQGQPLKRWQINDTICYEIAKWRSREMLVRLDPQVQACHAIHFDTIAAMNLFEDWNVPCYRRSDDVHFRQQMMEHYVAQGKAVAGEGMRDWSIPWQDYGTTKSYFPRVSGTDGRVWVLPLCELVYHDCVIRSYWEHYSLNDNSFIRHLEVERYWPFGMVLNSYLTASPPILFPEGKMYRYGFKEAKDAAGKTVMVRDWERREHYVKRFSDPDLQVALDEALKICKLNQRHGSARMLNHRFVDPSSPDVQESVFATGLHVVINYGDQPYQLSDGRTIEPRGALVEE